MGQALWVAAALSAGLIPFAVELTSYYAAILVCLCLLWAQRPAAGIALCAFSALSWGLAERFLYFDEIFTWISLAMLAAIVFVTAWLWRHPIPATARAAR